MLAVDAGKKAAVCQFCGEAFIVQEAINNYNTYNINNYNTTNNYGDGAVVNVYEERSKDFVVEAGVLKEYHGESLDVIIPDNVKIIGEKCFAGSAIENVTFSSSVERICEEAFAECNRIKNIHIPSNILVIESGAFSCENLTTLTFDEGIKEIQSGAFNGCHSLETLELPSSLLYVAGFSYCENLKRVKINYGPSCIKYEAFSYGDYIKNSLEEVEIPESVKTIDKRAFEYCKNLKSINLPDSVLNIGNGAFKGCENLTNVKLSNSITKIENETFWGCKKLKTITIPNGVTEIEMSAFFHCENLRNVIFPKNKITVGHCAFLGCENLKIVVPNNVGFGRAAFPSGCVSQKEFEKEQKRVEWKRKGLCQYCGGKLRYSIFGGGKECRNCGHHKDY